MTQTMRILVAGVFLISLYAGSYVALYTHSHPAGNLAYWVYLRGGDETEYEEQALYYFYYPIYKIHRQLGAGRHNYDRGFSLSDVRDGDEPTNNVSR